MKFHEFFEKNRKLLKLNFVLLGTFIFFMTLQFANVCYAVTDDDLSKMGLTTAEWAEEVIRHNNISMSTPFIVWRAWDYDKEAVHTYVYTYPDLSPDMLLTFSAKSSRMLMNFTSHTDLTNILKSDFVVVNSGDGVNLTTYDYDLTGHSFTNSYLMPYTTDTITFHSGTIEQFTLNNNIRLGNYAVSDVNKGLDYIQYTNFNSYYLQYIGIKNFEESKKLLIYNYDSYISYGSDDQLGDYIKFDNSLKNTNVSSILFEGSDIMNHVTKYTVSTLTNLDTFKMYVNKSRSVTITMRDVAGKVLYTTTKNYDSVNDSELNNIFDYGFDVSNSEVGEFNGRNYYINMGFYFKYNNVYNYNTEIIENSTVYIPRMSYDIVLNNGKVYSGYFVYHDFDIKYFVNLESALVYAGDSVRNEYDLMKIYNVAYDAGTNIMEFLINGYLYSVRINLTVDKFSVDNDLNLTYLATVHKNSVTQNFSVDNTNAVGTVVDLIDGYGNDYGFVVVDNNGKITSSSFNQSWITADDSHVYDDLGGEMFTFSSTQDGWVLTDWSGNVIKEHTVISITDKIQDTNNKVDSNIVNNFTDSITMIANTITGSLSALLTSVTGIAALFGSAFSWLPEPVPQLVVFVFSAMAIFALIRFIRGH